MLEQALFTSCRGNQLDGYQMVATSPGFDEADARELTRWCPTHEALLDPSEAGESLNFHQLRSGRFCLSHTAAAGEEYSGRGGLRVATRLFVFERSALARFANSPFRLFEALLADGHVDTDNESPSLASLSLIGGAAPFDAMLVASVNTELGPRRLSRLVDAVLDDAQVYVIAETPAFDRLLATLFCLLPLETRPEVSFCTGLTPSASRRFRLQPIPSSVTENRRLARQSGIMLLDFSNEAPAESLRHEWARLVEHALTERKYRWLHRQLSAPRHVLI